LFAYRFRPRELKIKNGLPLEFPNACTITVALEPRDLFGGEVGSSPILTLDREAELRWNPNIGNWCPTSKEPFPKVTVQGKVWTGTMVVEGAEAKLTLDCYSHEHLTNGVNMLYAWLPATLSIALAAPVRIVQLQGVLGHTVFTAEIPLSRWKPKMEVVNAQYQEEKILHALSFLRILPHINRARIFAALNYFHLARRLACQGETEFEFWGEMILNALKAVEALLTPNRETQRTELSKLGLPVEQVAECVDLLKRIRDTLDIAHLTLSTPTVEERDQVEAFGRFAMHTVKTILAAACEKAVLGEYSPLDYGKKPPNRRARRLIDDLQHYMEEYASEIEQVAAKTIEIEEQRVEEEYGEPQDEGGGYQ